MEWWVELMPPDVGDTASEPTESDYEISYQERSVWLRCRRTCRKSLLRALDDRSPCAEETELGDERDPEDAR